MAFVYAYFFSDFLRFDMSLLLLTVTLWGVSNKHFLLSLFHFSHCCRSQCSVVAKWTYTKMENGGGGFSKEFYTMIGLEDLVENDCHKIGKLHHVNTPM